ncbi:MAG TPA: hypothetical protein VGL40_06145 [Bacillota bacterium]
MPTKLIRRPGLFVIAVVGLALAFGLSFGRIERVLTRTPEVVVSGGWGAASGDFGRDQAPDGRVFGPRSFALDGEGQVYVADSANHRVKKYSPEGRLVLQFPVGEGLGYEPSLDDLAVAVDGSIYLADNSRGVVLKYDQDGRPQATIEVKRAGPAASLWRVEALVPADQGGIYVLGVAMAKDGYVGTISLYSGRGTVLATPAKVALDTNGRPRAGTAGGPDGPIEGFVPLGRGAVAVMTAGRTPFQRRFFIQSEDGRTVESFLHESTTFIETAILLGADGNGCLYLGTDLGLPDGRVVKIGPDGRVQEVIDPAAGALSESDPATLVAGRIDARGRLYLVRVTASGFSIVRSTPNSHLILRSPFRPTTGEDEGSPR